VAAGVSDQALASGANAVLNIVLARWLSVEEYGIFCLGFTIYLIASGFHNSLILEPVSVLGASRFAGNLRVYLRSVFWNQLILAVLIAAILAGGAVFAPIGADVKIAVCGAGILCPSLLTVLYLRRIQYLLGRPQAAAYMSLVYAMVLVILFGVARYRGRLSALTGLIMIAAAAAVACRPYWRDVFACGPGPSCKASAEAHWGFGRWFIAAPFLAVGTTHIQMLVVAGCLGMEGSGALRATMNFTLPLVQLVTALSNLALPSLARTFAERPAGFKTAAVKVMLGYGAGGGLYMVCLWLFGRPLEMLVYGNKFRGAGATLSILGVWAFAVCLSNATGIVLRARQAPKGCLLAMVLAAIFGFAATGPLVRWYGLPGAAASMAGTYIVSTIVQFVAYRRTRDLSGVPVLPSIQQFA
jgi:O-antigen/teichoic acid export membrane protein